MNPNLLKVILLSKLLRNSPNLWLKIDETIPMLMIFVILKFSKPEVPNNFF